MTTPERLKRRQLIEGALLIVLGIGMVIQTAYFQHLDNKQKDCLQSNLVALSESLDTRANITQKESGLIRNYFEVYIEAAGLVKDPENPELSEEDRNRLNQELVRVLLELEDGLQEIEKDRKANPVPEFPAGICE